MGKNGRAVNEISKCTEREWCSERVIRGSKITDAADIDSQRVIIVAGQQLTYRSVQVCVHAFVSSKR